MTTDADIDLSSLPQVDQTASPPVPRRPRSDGDVSDLPDRACWALQHLHTRRYISAESDADVYSWVNSCPRWGNLVVTPPNGFVSHPMSVDVPICSATVSSVD
jgi:hypothetical protein